jgi:alginate O-acetyltransferase complex protein AlgI
MLFPTIEFAIFFAVVFAAAWSVNQLNNFRKWLLVLASYFFYGFWSTDYLALLVFLSVFNFLMGLQLERSRGAATRRLVLMLGVTTNLAILAYFKYANFLVAKLINLISEAGLHVELSFVELATPVAISFITFHCLAYLIDVYRGTISASRSLVDILLYLSFFPHLIAGPIVRPRSFLAQLKSSPVPESIELGRSCFLILSGLFKKVVIASYLASELVDPVFRAPANFTSLDLLLATYGYAIQIYCDFSAYTDIAIGIANLLGYRFPTNFNQPYRALSLQDFWRRWHITLSSWLRDYLYIPLGGSRCGALRTNANILITMCLGGLWHGASDSFIVWGLLHGTWLIAERGVKTLLGSATFLSTRLAVAARWLITFHFVCFAWIFFRSATLDLALDYFRNIFRGGIAISVLSPLVGAMLILGALTHILSQHLIDQLVRRFDSAPSATKILIATGAIFVICVLAPAGVPAFIYFQF